MFLLLYRNVFVIFVCFALFQLSSSMSCKHVLIQRPMRLKFSHVSSCFNHNNIACVGLDWTELMLLIVFTARAYARAVLGVVILSVRLSHAWIVTKLNDALRIV